jgi:hypothetical protein
MPILLLATRVSTHICDVVRASLVASRCAGSAPRFRVLLSFSPARIAASESFES